jgi:signal transduction histidine kinase
MTRRSGLRRAEWLQQHHEALLTAAPLVVMVIAGYPSRRVGWQWELLLGALAWLPLIVRNRWPALVLTVVAAVDSVSIGVAGHAHPPGEVLPAATMLALYTVSVRWPARWAWAAGSAVGAVQFIVAATTPNSLAQDVLYLNWAVVATAVGQLVRERRATLAAADQRAAEAERSKEAEAQRRVVAERMRIAHELHDVLAHHIAVVNAQAGVAQYLLETDPAAALKALHGITTNSRAALDELRLTLGLLRGEVDASEYGGGLVPAPSLEHLDGLLQTFIQAGMCLSVDVRGSRRALSTATELALVRIIQEALTNASKHAPGSAVALELDWSGSPVRLCVTNERASRAGPLANEGTGYGLIGMRERAAIANGSVSTGPTPEGGYRVVAAFPTSGDASDDGTPIAEARSEKNDPRDEPTAP